MKKLSYQKIAKQWYKNHPCKNDNNPYRVLVVKDIKVPKKMQKIKLARDSIWGNPKRISTCTVTNFYIENHIDNGNINHPYILIYANHNLPWQIYTDNGFEKNFSKMVSKLLGIPNLRIRFTEQGMQEDKIASLETSEKSACALGRFVLENQK